MPWSREFPTPITLKDGRMLTTLADARAFIKSLLDQRRQSEHWLYASGLTAKAASSSGTNALLRAAAKLALALKAEGLL
jgi:hypothetical protein